MKVSAHISNNANNPEFTSWVASSSIFDDMGNWRSNRALYGSLFRPSGVNRVYEVRCANLPEGLLLVANKMLCCCHGPRILQSLHGMVSSLARGIRVREESLPKAATGHVIRVANTACHMTYRPSRGARPSGPPVTGESAMWTPLDAHISTALRPPQHAFRSLVKELLPHCVTTCIEQLPVPRRSDRLPSRELRGSLDWPRARRAVLQTEDRDTEALD